MRNHSLSHRQTGDGSDVPEGRAEAIRRARMRAMQRRDDAPDRVVDHPNAYPEPFSPWPHESDGFPRRGFAGADADVIFERDSDALYLPDPATAPNDTAPLARAGERAILDGVGEIERSNISLDLPPFGLEDL